MFVRHTTAKVTEVLELLESGLSDYAIAKNSGMSPATIKRWRQLGVPPVHGEPPKPLARPLDVPAYSYLLGMYLGDGWVGPMARTWGMKIALDASYPDVVRECVVAMGRVATARVTVLLRHERSTVVVQAHGRDWPSLFPQHGPGKKHERKIELVDWQLLITRQYAREFIRGLIHSDGSRCINRFSVKLPSGRVGRYAYPRYFFTNYSADIRGIFCAHCDLLGIRWSQSNPRNISVANRESVALLDSFVGPKS
jgi:hypothetical protein